jgi:hypothetical protein
MYCSTGQLLPFLSPFLDSVTLAAALTLCDPDQSGIGPSSCVRYWWYGTFSTKELASEDGESCWPRKPDLLLLEGASGVTVHILSHCIYLFSFLCRTHLLWGLYSYDWYHCMYIIGSTSFSLFLL